jgi:glutamate-1-semialdehyde 2,1-aminomutase
MRQTQLSSQQFARGNQFIPNGVSSPMRTFSLVGNNPIIIKTAKGSTITDIDNNHYTDFLSGFGALFLGHAREEINNAVKAQLDNGLIYGLTTELEYNLAQKIVESTPAIDSLRFVCSGSEAVMTAVRIARAHTERKTIVKFVGSYHGHTDPLLALPTSSDTVKTKGATDGTVENHVIVCEYNNSQQLEDIFKQNPDSIAAVIVEPIATNMGFVPPVAGFHQSIRSLCDQYGALFIFDEVVTGFRFTFGGVSQLFDIDPDLTTFGKIIGGGASIGAYAGKAEFMDNVKIGNRVFQSGTFAGNPVSMAAGNAALDLMAMPGFYSEMDAKGALLEESIKKAFAEHNIPFLFNRFGCLSGISFREQNAIMSNYSDVQTQLYDVYRDVHSSMLEKGFLMAPSLEEPIFLTAAHSSEDINRFARAIGASIASALEDNYPELLSNSQVA